MKPESEGVAIYTIARIAAALGNTPRAVRKALADVPPAGVRIVAGNEAAAWSVASLPEAMRARLTDQAVAQRYRNAEALLSDPPKRWEPALPLEQIDQGDIESAQKLRDALRPWLSQQHDLGLAAAEMEARGVEDYRRAFGHNHRISTRHWRELFKRTLKRDGGEEDWNRLAIYLPDRPKMKQLPTRIVSEAITEVFRELDSFIAGIREATAQQKRDIWVMALRKYLELSAKMSPKKAARLCRQFLFARAPFLAASRNALLKAFDRKAELLKHSNGDFKVIADDRRVSNGERFVLPAADVRRLRWSAAFQNGGRVDAAWREEYHHLTLETRTRYPWSVRAPRVVHEALNRQVVDALHARHEGKRKLKRLIGGIEREWLGIPSMTTWAVDDMTSNIEVAGREPGTLFQPQIVAVMDGSARKFVAWAISDDKGPTAELSCAAVLAGFKTHGVPKELGVENGFVFGNAVNINGKIDDQGRTVVGGLARYGCALRHFERMNPTSKAELEKAFDLIQQKMERHPGYAGRLQMVDAPEDFKREQRLIRSGKAEAEQFRYTFSEFVTVANQLFCEYNSKPQEGWLKGLSPNEAFEALRDPSDPPIQFTAELEWLLANERYLVQVDIGGVKIPSHYGQPIRVRGGQLTGLVGSELWALIHRQDDSLVTFMKLNFADPFTMEVCQKPSACERLIASGSGVLASERAKVREHERAVDEEYKGLLQDFGNPRRDLLLAIRNQQPPQSTPRLAIVPPRWAEAAAEMDRQRGEIRAERAEESTRTRTTQNRARKLGLPTRILNDGPESDEGTALMLAAEREHRRKQDNSVPEESL